MKIFRILLLAVAMGLFALNFLAVEAHDLWSKQSIWAYVRIGIAFLLILILIAGLRRDMKRKKQNT